MSVKSPGQRFRDAVAEEHPLQVIGAINANHALLAKRAGFKAIYLSGGGVEGEAVGIAKAVGVDFGARAGGHGDGGQYYFAFKHGWDCHGDSVRWNQYRAQVWSASG